MGQTDKYKDTTEPIPQPPAEQAPDAAGQDDSGGSQTPVTIDGDGLGE